MTNEKAPERIFISLASLPQSLKDGAGSFYPNFTGDAAQFNLVAYVPESRVAEEREAAFKVAIDIAQTAHAQYKNQSSLREAITNALEAAATENRKEEGMNVRS